MLTYISFKYWAERRKKLKYFTIEKEVTLNNHWLTIRPSTDRSPSNDEKDHYHYVLADVLHSLKWRHFVRYFKVEICDHIFHWAGTVFPCQIDLGLPINHKKPCLLDEIAQEAISRAEIVLDKEVEREKKRKLALYNLQNEKSAWLGARS